MSPLPRYCQHIKLASLLILYTLLLSPNPLQADEIAPAEFTLDPDSVKIEADCSDNILLIKWTNLSEPNVTGFKIHSSAFAYRAQDTINRWLNPIAIVAKGAAQQYIIIGTSFEPNTPYTLRLYGFEKNKLLSKAHSELLSDNFVLQCTHLPITISP